jgi:CBS domain containing-hemolysin-like protein
MAVVISTVLVVLFAEIIPQAVCSKHGLALGSIFYIPIKILIGFWFIIAWPISKVLGWVIGTSKGTIYTPQGKRKQSK